MARPAPEIEPGFGRRRALAEPSLSPTRAAGAALLAASAVALLRLHFLVLDLPRHQPTPAEMLLSLAAVLSGFNGTLAAIVGGDLFRPVLSRGPR